MGIKTENSEIYYKKHEHPHTKPYVRGFFVLLIITLIEVAIPMTMSDPRWLVVTLLITFTLIKAAYIIMVFMHMGEEYRDLAVTILVPFLMFAGYFIWAMLNEGTFTLWSNNFFG